MEDLVAVGVADPGDEGLVLEQVLQLAGVAPDALLPGGQGQGRVVGVRAELVVQPGDRPNRAVGDEVDLAHLGRIAIANLDRLIVSGQPSGALRPAGDSAFRGSRPRTEPEHEGRLRGQLGVRQGQLESAGEHRIEDDPVVVELQQQELAPLLDRADLAADEAGQLGRRAPHGERSMGHGRADPATGQGRLERFGDDGEIGQLRHAGTIVGREKPVLDSPGPTRQDSRRTSPAAIDHEGAN